MNNLLNEYWSALIRAQKSKILFSKWVNVSKKNSWPEYSGENNNPHFIIGKWLTSDHEIWNGTIQINKLHQKRWNIMRNSKTTNAQTKKDLHFLRQLISIKVFVLVILRKMQGVA